MKWSRHVSLVRALVVAVASATGLLLAVQCSSVSPEETGGGTHGPAGLGPGVSTGACTHEGQSQACHAIVAQHNGYVDCFSGEQTCGNGTWGPCDGSGGAGGGTLSTHALPLEIGGLIGGLHPDSLSDASDTTPPCSTDPCNPYCWGFTEAPSTAIGPAPGCVITYAAAPAGVCRENTGGYAGLPSVDKVNVTSCNPAGLACPALVNILGVNLFDTAGVCDDCNFDTYCSGGTCAQWAVGGDKAAGSCPGCTGGDLTLGYPCLDSPPSSTCSATCSAPTFHMSACNRGSSTLSGTGPTGAGPAIHIGLYKSANITSGSPLHSQCVKDGNPSSPDDGEIVYPTTNLPWSLAPGACVDINETNSTHTCNNNDLTTSGERVVVNWNGSVHEDNYCNNWNMQADAACTSVACTLAPDAGVVVDAAAADAGCHTYVSGIVYDPGGNVPVPGVQVYEPDIALPLLPVGPSCDTCTSVLPPAANILHQTTSAVDGSFRLEVTSTSGIPVVFQTGRWRREIQIGTDTPTLAACAVTNLTVPADCAYPATKCKTRLPQTHLEGDIPLTAILTEGYEAFECSIAKFMGGEQEFGVGGAYRLQLFHDTGATALAQPSVLLKSGTTAALTAPPPTVSGHGWIASAFSAGTLTVTNLGSANDSGTKWSSTAGVPETIGGLAALTPAYVGGNITLSGGTAGNTGTWAIGSDTATTVTITNGGTTESGAGTHSWNAVLPTGPLTSQYVGGKLALSGGANAGNNGTGWIIESVLSSTSVTVADATGSAPDANSGLVTANWTATAGGPFQVTGLTGMSATDVGNTITFTGAASAANNGAFTINTVVNATTILITNASAVFPDANNGSIRWTETSPPSTVTLPSVSATVPWSALTGYSELIAGCDGGGGFISAISGVPQGLAYTFAEAGGKIMVNHKAAKGLFIPVANGGQAIPPYDTTATFAGLGTTASNLTGKVAPGGSPTAGQTLFQTWLTAEGAYGGGCTAGVSGLCTPVPVPDEALNPSPTLSFEWLRGATSDSWSTNPAGNYSLMYSFDSTAVGPVATLGADGGVGTGCGRTIVSDMHIADPSSGRGKATGTIGGSTDECTLGFPLTANEKAFEFLWMELSACSIGSVPPAPPPPPPPPVPTIGAPPAPTTYSNTYTAVCPAGTHGHWDNLAYNVTTPTGTDIKFAVQTGDTTTGPWHPTLPAGPPAGILVADAPLDHPGGDTAAMATLIGGGAVAGTTSCTETGPAPCGNNCGGALYAGNGISAACPASCVCPIDVSQPLITSSQTTKASDTASDLQLNVLLTPAAGTCTGAFSPGLLTSPSGINCCTGAKNVVTPGGACTVATQYSACDQDYHCDLTVGSPTYGTCQYNNGPIPWIDPTCVVGGQLGFDLTIEAGCTDGTGNHVPICNRGGATIPAGQVITITGDNSGGGCTKACTGPGGGQSSVCSYALQAPLTAGTCIDIPPPGSPGLSPAAGCTFPAGEACQQINLGNTVVDVNGNKECNTTAYAPTWPTNGGGAGCQNNDAAIKATGTGGAGCVCGACGPAFVPPAVPSLVGWNVTYSCVPSE